MKNQPMILSNRVMCNNCKDIIISRYRWDYVLCSCGNIAVDGGNDYLRRIGSPLYTEMAVEDDGRHEIRRANSSWGVTTTKDGTPLNGVFWKPIKDLDTDHIEAILETQSSISPLYSETLKVELVYRELLELLNK